MTDTLAPRMAALALAAIQREYPSHVVHLLRGDGDARPPHQLTPAFFGSFDWHSAVHGHWCLARLARRHPDAGFAAEARSALARSLTAERIAGELAYFRTPGREGFERPYGLAWLLQLAAELRDWPEAVAWRHALSPLETLAADRLAAWLERLPGPVRTGEHGQSAFAMGLALDWARAAGETPLAHRITSRAAEFYGADVAAPIAYEPSGHDFLSPALGEADLMRRVLPSDAFVRWFAAFLPDLEGEPARRWLTPVRSPDPSDGKLSHLDGLNLSRAWMLEAIASALPAEGAPVTAMRQAAARHREAGLGAVSGEHYAGAHWLASFAVYLTT
jgi:hypothetical protein